MPDYDDGLVSDAANRIWLELAGQIEPDVDFDHFVNAARAAIAAVLEWQGLTSGRTVLIDEDRYHELLQTETRDRADEPYQGVE